MNVLDSVLYVATLLGRAKARIGMRRAMLRMGAEKGAGGWTAHGEFYEFGQVLHGSVRTCTNARKSSLFYTALDVTAEGIVPDKRRARDDVEKRVSSGRTPLGETRTVHVPVFRGARYMGKMIGKELGIMPEHTFRGIVREFI